MGLEALKEQGLAHRISKIAEDEKRKHKIWVKQSVKNSKRKRRRKEAQKRSHKREQNKKVNSQR